jgi:hypothetical protein
VPVTVVWAVMVAITLAALLASALVVGVALGTLVSAGVRGWLTGESLSATVAGILWLWAAVVLLKWGWRVADSAPARACWSVVMMGVLVLVLAFVVALR